MIGKRRKTPQAMGCIVSGERKAWWFSFGFVNPHRADKIRLRRGDAGRAVDAFVHHKHRSALVS
jgi:hypothetical protein